MQADTASCCADRIHSPKEYSVTSAWKKALRAHVQSHENLLRDSQLLQSVAAYAGLAPCEQRSGSRVSKVTTLSKHGNSRLRKAFYFPAVSAMQWNPLVKAHSERLRAAGKPKMVALAACLRKLLMICYGVLKHQQPFDARWLSPASQAIKQSS